MSFTGPKLYSCYCIQINSKGNPKFVHKFCIGYRFVVSLRKSVLDKTVAYLKRWVLEAWGACSHKKIVAASAATVFWNLTAIRTRIFAGNSFSNL